MRNRTKKSVLCLSCAMLLWGAGDFACAVAAPDAGGAPAPVAAGAPVPKSVPKTDTEKLRLDVDNLRKTLQNVQEDAKHVPAKWTEYVAGAALLLAGGALGMTFSGKYDTRIKELRDANRVLQKQLAAVQEEAKVQADILQDLQDSQARTLRDLRNRMEKVEKEPRQPERTPKAEALASAPVALQQTREEIMAEEASSFVAAYVAYQQEERATSFFNQKPLMARFCEEHQIRALECSNAEARMQNGANPIAFADTHPTNGVYWACPLSDGMGYAVVPHIEEYHGSLHAAGGMKEAFESNFVQGNLYHTVHVLQAAIYTRDLQTCIRKGELRLES